MNDDVKNQMATGGAVAPTPVVDPSVAVGDAPAPVAPVTETPVVEAPAVPDVPVVDAPAQPTDVGGGMPPTTPPATA